MEFFKLYSHTITKDKLSPDFNKLYRRLNKENENSELEQLFLQCVAECQAAVNFSASYMLLPITADGDIIDFDAFSVQSASLSKNLAGCESCIIFGATLGIGLDRIIDKYSKFSPLKAFICQSIGAEYIESYCDELCRYFETAQKLHTRPRFSPGYGDLSIDVQKKLFEILSLPKNCGLTLTESLIMRPSKSVTAFVGLSDTKCSEHNKCAECDREDCIFKKN